MLPGLGNSGEQHWQTLWEKQFQEITRINQSDWETPVCEDWISVIDEKISAYDLNNVILVGHSLACCTVVFGFKKYNKKIKGALLIAPSDTEAPSYPKGTSGFKPIPLIKLPFNSIVAASTNDFYVSMDRAKLFADSWGSELRIVGDAGHINTASGHGKWDEGLEFLRELDNF